MDFAEAINLFTDAVSEAMARGERHGLSDTEMVAELRRLAAETEAEIARAGAKTKQRTNR